MAAFTLLEDRRVSTQGQVQQTKRHDKYVTVCPVDVQDRLESAGYEVDRTDSAGGGWQVALTVTRPYRENRDTIAPGYGSQVSILLNHKGTSSIRIQRGAVRYACHNAFHRDAELVRINHCSQEALDFATDPAKLIDTLMGEAVQDIQHMVEAIEAQVGQGDGRLMLAYLLRDKPRAYKEALKIAEARYDDVTRPLQVINGEIHAQLSIWSTIQALTDGDGKYPKARREAAEVLFEPGVLTREA